MTLLNEQNRQQLIFLGERNSPKIPCKPSQAPKTCRKESSSHKVAIKHTMSKSFMWVLCIGEKKNFSSQHSMPLPGTTGIVKHKLLPEKVFGEKKGKKECRRRLYSNMYCICIRVPKSFQNVIIINRLEDNVRTKIGLFSPCSAALPIPKMPKILEECN